MAGCDEKNTVRLLVEAKFWATLLQGQASGYMQLFDTPDPAVLLFIAPRVRIRTKSIADAINTAKSAQPTQ